MNPPQSNSRSSAGVVETRELTRVVGTEDGDRRIVDCFSYRFEAGRMHNVIGPSGAGKSSLLRLLNRLDEPTSGDVLLDGKPAREYNPCDLRLKVGFLFQTPHLFDGTVRDNLTYVDKRLEVDRMKACLDKAYLPVEMLDRKAEKLSVGEKQRVALARLLLSDPEVILLDEPTSALDPAATKSIERLIKDVASGRKATVVTVTHDPQQAVRLGGEGLLMFRGRLIESGSVEQIVNDPQSDEGRRYKAQELR